MLFGRSRGLLGIAFKEVILSTAADPKEESSLLDLLIEVWILEGREL